VFPSAQRVSKGQNQDDVNARKGRNFWVEGGGQGSGKLLLPAGYRRANINKKKKKTGREERERGGGQLRGGDALSRDLRGTIHNFRSHATTG